MDESQVRRIKISTSLYINVNLVLENAIPGV